MNAEIYDLLKSLELFDEEIEQCFVLCPGLNIVDKEKAAECLNVLVKNGYPKEDVGLLIVANPGILMYEPVALGKKLASLGGDIEEILKDNPFAI